MTIRKYLIPIGIKLKTSREIVKWLVFGEVALTLALKDS
jgi:hypothetical protein